MYGDCLKINGKKVIHQEYGEQFKIESFEKIFPETTASFEKYLASGTIKGIGPATARKIVDKFGADSLNVFKFEPLKLAQIRGITKERAYEIGEEFNEKWEIWQIVGFLERFGISASSSKKVYDALGKDAVQKIEEDPYVLIDIVYGVDFRKIDRIALEIGVPKTSETRIKSGIKYALLTSSYNGNTCVLRENLVDFVKNVLEVSEEDITDEMINLNAKQEIYIEERENGEEWVYLYPFYKAEINIVERLCKLDEAKNVKHIKNFATEVRIQEKLLNIELSEKQFEAINQINDHNICIITGGPRNW